jgi:hypothetical protein
MLCEPDLGLRCFQFECELSIDSFTEWMDGWMNR